MYNRFYCIFEKFYWIENITIFGIKLRRIQYYNKENNSINFKLPIYYDP